MRIFVNNKPVNLLPGMTVRHALISAGMSNEIKEGKKVYDECGNELGLDGALEEGQKIFIQACVILPKNS